MSTEANIETKKERTRRRWLGRWLLKLALWFGALTLSVMFIACVVAFIAYHNLTGLANLAINRFAHPYRVELGVVDVTKRGEIHVEQVAVRPPLEIAVEGDQPWLILDGVDLTYDFDELKQSKKFRTIVLRHPVVRIDDASLDTLGGTSTNDGETGLPPPPIDLSHLGNVADRIEVVGGELVVDTSLGPRLEGKWDASIPAIDFSAEEWLNEEPMSLRITQVRVGPEGTLGSIDRISLKGRLRGDLSALEIAEFAIDAPKLSVTPAWLPRSRIGDESAPDIPMEKLVISPVVTAPESVNDLANREPFQILLGALMVKGVELGISGFEGTDGTPRLPDLSLTTEIAWRDLTIEGGRLRSDAPLSLTMANLEIGGKGDAKRSVVQVERLAIQFDPEAVADSRRIESIELDAPRLFLTPESVKALGLSEDRAPDSAASTPPANPDSTGRAAAAPVPNWEIGALRIRDGEIEAMNWVWNGNQVPAVSLKWNVDSDGLSAASLGLVEGGGKTDGDGEQAVTLSEIRIEGVGPDSVGKGDSEPPIQVGTIETRFRLWAVLNERRIDSLSVENAAFNLTNQTLPDWIRKWENPGTTSDEKEAAPAVSGESVPALIPWSVGELEIGDGAIRLDTDALGGRLPKLDGRFSLAALASSSGSDGVALPSGVDRPFRLRLQDFRVGSREVGATAAAAPAAPPKDPREPLGGLFPDDQPDSDKPSEPFAHRIREQDVAMVKEISVDFTAAGIQRDHRIERIEVRGGEVQLGDGLRQLVEGPKAEPETPLPAPPEPSPPVPPADAPPADAPQAAAVPETPVAIKEWRVGEVVVTETQVRFQTLIPQIEGLEFAIETKLNDIPLGEIGLLSQEKKQKVEIAGIEIRDPYDSFITVAFLPTIFVEFSLAGLVNQRIDKIDLISPEIYVGQGLFWWIDYQRNYRKENEGVGFGLDGKAAVEVVVAETVDEGGGVGTDWEITELNAHLGKIIIAPAGQPIGVVPFPFSANTNLIDGEIALKLQIPREKQYVYQFPDFELDLFGLAGAIEFNVPVRQKDNNLVQTFELDRAVWKQHEAENLYLSVTYDTNGVYGRFGGSAYTGYAEGQFNVYLDGESRWDAWIAGTNMEMGPITRVLAPENFLMEGRINAKLVSEGRGLVFGETWGEIQTLSPGSVTITKLGDMIDELPGDWSQLKRTATQLSLEMLKDFEYEKGRGDLYFVNQDGWMRLDLEGPKGSRVLEMYAHDWREGEKAGSEKDPGESEPAAGLPIPDLREDIESGAEAGREGGDPKLPQIAEIKGKEKVTGPGWSPQRLRR